MEECTFKPKIARKISGGARKKLAGNKANNAHDLFMRGRDTRLQRRSNTKPEETRKTYEETRRDDKEEGEE